MQDKVKQVLVDFLSEMCPEGGVAYILTKYSEDYDSYFPLAWACKRNGDQCTKCQIRYHMLRYDLPVEAIVDTSDFILEEMSLIDLLQRGRLECVCDIIPAAQRIDTFCDNNFLVVRSQRKESTVTLEPLNGYSRKPLENLLTGIFNLWKVAPALYNLETLTDIDSVLDAVARKVADLDSTPPYYPILEGKITLNVDSDDTPPTRSFRNVLSWNGLILSLVHEGIDKSLPWLTAMKETPQIYKETDESTYGTEWKNIWAKYCNVEEIKSILGLTDIIHNLGKINCTKTGAWMFYARHNVPNENVEQEEKCLNADLFQFANTSAFIRQLVSQTANQRTEFLPLWAIPNNKEILPILIGVDCQPRPANENQSYTNKLDFSNGFIFEYYSLKRATQPFSSAIETVSAEYLHKLSSPIFEDAGKCAAAVKLLELSNSNIYFERLKGKTNNWGIPDAFDFQNNILAHIFDNLEKDKLDEYKKMLVSTFPWLAETGYLNSREDCRKIHEIILRFCSEKSCWRSDNTDRLLDLSVVYFLLLDIVYMLNRNIEKKLIINISEISGTLCAKQNQTEARYVMERLHHFFTKAVQNNHKCVIDSIEYEQQNTALVIQLDWDATEPDKERVRGTFANRCYNLYCIDGMKYKQIDETSSASAFIELCLALLPSKDGFGSIGNILFNKSKIYIFGRCI